MRRDDWWQEERYQDAQFAARVERGLCGICADVLRASEERPDRPRECPRHGAMP